jgi:hypothetical protein
MLHSEIIPEQNCDGELIELLEDGQRISTSPSVLVAGRNLHTFPIL